MGSRVSFKSHHLRAGRAKYATKLELEIVGPGCELRVTLSQRAGDDNISAVPLVQTRYVSRVEADFAVFLSAPRHGEPRFYTGYETRSRAVAKASRESERSRLRRRPRSTSPRPPPRAAPRRSRRIPTFS